MKVKSLLLCAVVLSLTLSSCGTIFTSSKQEITFKGVHGTDLYDSKDKKVGEIGKNGFATVQLKKKLKSQKITARLDGYSPRVVEVKAKFNPVAIGNLICPVPWIIDLATGKACKYSGDVVDATLLPTDNSGASGSDDDVISSEDGWIE